ncbi:MAG: hypothetical protein KKI06_05270 [Euryarchaeota archaeon]|nr:hypothetical protein [Euryarchaeota archaeon]
MPDFDIFTNRCTITASIELETPLRIGGGQNAAAYSISAAPVIQTFNAKTKIYEPYIPGSSLKGVLRSTVERIIRTFNEKESCISIGAGQKPCGDCISCAIFGSMDAGAKVRVRDAHLLNKSGILVKEQPHCATLYDRDLNPIKDYKNRVKTSLRMEETVASGVCFNIQIDIDNAKDIEIGLVLLALDEFNKKRIQLGGGASRGNGFADINLKSVTKKLISDSLKISEVHQDSAELMKDAKKYLKSIDSGKDSTRRDFDVYFNAHAPIIEGQIPDGHIVTRLKVTTLKDFIMPGAEEATVTGGGGLHVIPGSTIKGFFRHTLIAKELKADTIKEIFGFTDNHRGRLLVSDAYSDDLEEYDRIPKDSELKMWMVFDNMTKEEIGLISDIIKNGNNIVTGRTSSKLNTKTGEVLANLVKIEFEKLEIFRISSYLAGI